MKEELKKEADAFLYCCRVTGLSGFTLKPTQKLLALALGQKVTKNRE
jgi:hypothetical protein